MAIETPFSSVCMTPLCAYLDPGTGSMLVYFLMGIFASILYSFKGAFYKIKTLILGRNSDKTLRDLKDIDILFYSEGGHYWNVYLPIIESLEKQGIKSAYYTSSKDDIGLNHSFEYLRARFIGSGLTGFTLLNNIKVKVVVMTTPQLDVMQLRRSKFVSHYIHIVHAPTDALMIKKFAFDYFDSVMCSGPHQIDSILELEKVRELPNKILLETGLTYYDVMLRDRKKHCNQSATRKTILIAPTWGVNSLLTKYGAQPIKELLKEDYNVILRPHPQAYVSQASLMKEIEEQLSEYTNLIIDKKPSGESSMGQADVLISDLSGIVFDFIFIYEKPVITISNSITTDGFEAEDVSKDVWEIANIGEVSTLVDGDKMSNLTDIVSKVISDGLDPKVLKIREQILFNLGNAGSTASKQILEILSKLQ